MGKPSSLPKSRLTGIELERRPKPVEELVIDSPGRILASYFYKPSETARILLISGFSGVGKTHWCTALFHEAKIIGLDVKGLISVPVFKNKVKTAINLNNLENGSTRPLAYRADTRNEVGTIGNWVFNEETLMWGNEILDQIQSCQVLIIDELGPMEFDLHKGLKSAFKLVESGRYELACVVVRPGLIDAAQSVWHSAEIFFVPDGSEKQ